ncbi:MAG: hypothetical protein KDI13_02025 [Alphaproteobacteria bacterium]|nr:hypothetical protein [Alphaproteobacteria bacterium]
MRKGLIFTFLALMVLVLPYSARAQTQGAENVRLQALVDMLEQYELGLAYLGQCDDFKKQTTNFPFYLQNAQAVSMAIGAELKKAHPEKPGQVIVDSFEKKKDELGKKTWEQIKTDGCAGSSAQKAKMHFDSYRQISPAQLKQLMGML